MAMISLKDVSKVYQEGARPALSHINLEIEGGEFVFLVGASGSGKTTLLQLLLREQQATSGQLHVIGEDLRRLPDRLVPRYRRNIGFVFQDYKLLTGKTVWQNIAFALEVIGARRSVIKTRVAQVLTTVGLDGKENRLPSELSGGEAQRVAIARAYVNHPKLLLADEPTGNLDPTTSVGIMEVLDAINRTGDTTVVMATHNEEIVNSMKKRVVELHNGVMVRDEKNGGYDSAKYFPDAEVESKARRVNAGGSLAGLSAGAPAARPEAGSPETDARSSRPIHDSQHVESLKAARTVDDGSQDARASQGLRISDLLSPSSADGMPGQGTTDAGRASDSSSVREVRAHGARRGHGSGHPARPARSRQTFARGTARDARRAAEQSDDDLIEAAGGDPGIARLEKSIHSGRTGRYEESFRPVEETLTWGTGLTAAEIAGHGIPQERDGHDGAGTHSQDRSQGREDHSQDAGNGRGDRGARGAAVSRRIRDARDDGRTDTSDRGGAR